MHAFGLSLQNTTNIFRIAGVILTASPASASASA